MAASAITPVGPAESLPATLAGAAVAALRAEVDLTPKPGLVDRRDSGAHRDMSHALMHASCESLRVGFNDIAAAALHHRQADAQDAAGLRAELGVLGREAEARMMLVTGGVNTHRGAIWALGLLVAAAAAAPAPWRAASLLGWVAGMAAIDDPAISPARISNGLRAVRAFGVAGARAEAAAGYRQIPEAGLPALRRSRAAGASERVARLNALLALMAVLDDTCVLNRAGVAGLAATQAQACAILDAGGVGSPRGARALAALDRDLLARRASPGGSADLLAATLFIDALERAAGDWPARAGAARMHATEISYADTLA